MNISLANALGPAPAALELRSKRTEIIANNIANADTPNFKARDISFEDTLKSMLETDAPSARLTLTRNNHLAGSTPPISTGEAELGFRRALLPSLDGNTVDVHQEQAAFAENSLQFQAAFRFLNGRFQGLMTAIRGE